MLDTQLAFKQKLLSEIEATPQEYLPALLNIVRIYRQSVTVKPAANSFEIGWQEALGDETFPITELWEGIDVE